MTLRFPKKTQVHENPLHRFASYGYVWSLWYLSLDDFTNLNACIDVDSALNYKLSKNSYVIAQDSGVYPKQRQPNTLGLNYHIQDVQFDTVIAPNRVSRSSNMIQGGMTIIEPYGVTFVDNLVAASFDGTKYTNYCDRPYLLQLEFRGYDDNGDETTQFYKSIYTKRFPIRITTMKIDVTNRGAEYKLQFTPFGSLAHAAEFGNTPKNFNVTAGTVKEFFEEFQKQYRLFQYEQIVAGNQQEADGLVFDVDDTIGASKIVYEKNVGLDRANPKVKNIDLSKNSFSIPRGTPILDVITRVMAHSDYLLNLQLGLEKANKDGKTTDIFNAFKTLTQVQLLSESTGQANAFDVRRNAYAKTVTYKLHQYSSWKGNHPALPLYADSIPYTVKRYNYYYTGKNTDIIDLKLNFDQTYHSTVLAFTQAVSATEDTQNTNQNSSQLINRSQRRLNLNPAIFTALTPALGLVPNVTPLRYRLVVGNQNVTTGMNTINRPAAQVGADVIDSLYSSLTAANMVDVQMTIVGDPSLIKQDDWLYVPSPNQSTTYCDDQSAAEYADRYGHMRMDRGELIATLNINSPIDLDIDIDNQGLVYPQPQYSQSLFSGQYQIIRIENRFAGGKFEQILHMARIMNSDFVTAFQKLQQGGRAGGQGGAGSAGGGQANDTTVIPTNSSGSTGSSGAENLTETDPGRGLTLEVTGSREDPRR
jgi:hypothetical protein